MPCLWLHVACRVQILTVIFFLFLQRTFREIMFLQVTITDVFNLNKCHTIILLVYVSKTERDREFVDLMIYKSAHVHLTTHCSASVSTYHSDFFFPINVFIQLYYHPKGKLLYSQVLNTHRSQEHTDNNVLYILMQQTPVSLFIF